MSKKAAATAPATPPQAPDNNEIQPLPASAAEQGNADKGLDKLEGQEVKVAKKPVVPAKEAAPRPLRKLLSHQLQIAEYAQPWFRITIDDGDTIVDDLIKPEFWANVGEMLKPANGHAFPIIYVFWADASRFVELAVIDSGPQYAIVKVLRDVDLSVTMQDVRRMAEGTGDDRFRIEYKGPVVRWAVIRNSDNKIMDDKKASKGDAQKWLTEYLKALGT